MPDVPSPSSLNRIVQAIHALQSGGYAPALLGGLLQAEDEFGELARLVDLMAQHAALRRSGRTLAQFVSDLKLFPQVLINVRIPRGLDWQANAALREAREAAEAELGASGRVLIRASGTEPLLRVMVEAQDASQARALAQRLADTVAA